MELTGKIIIAWLSFIWIIFSIWLFSVTQFPLNFSVLGLESLGGIMLIWIMTQFRDISNIEQVPSE